MLIAQNKQSVSNGNTGGLPNVPTRRRLFGSPFFLLPETSFLPSLLLLFHLQPASLVLPSVSLPLFPSSSFLHCTCLSVPFLPRRNGLL